MLGPCAKVPPWSSYFYLSYFFSPLLYGRHAWPHLFSHPKWWVCKTSLLFSSIDLLHLPLTLASLRYSSARPCIPKGGWTHRARRAHQALHDNDEHTPHGELKRSDPATTKRDAREHCSEELGDRGGLSDIDVTKEGAKGDEVGHTIEHGLGHHRDARSSIPWLRACWFHSRRLLNCARTRCATCGDIKRGEIGR